MVAIGGGHGLAMSLRAIRTYADRVTAVVATSDDGGSSGRLRDALDMPAPGDLRRCLAAVAEDQALAASLEHRFSAGDLAGHAVGNLLLAGLVDGGSDLLEAADQVSRWLGIDPARARVVPATRQPVCMVGQTEMGEVRGQVAVEGTPGVIAIATDPPDPAVPRRGHRRHRVRRPDRARAGEPVRQRAVRRRHPRHPRRHRRHDARSVFVCNLRADEPGVKGFDVGRHLEVLTAHGVRIDTVVAQQGALALGDTGDVEVVIADIDRPHGLAHDAALLGAVLARLA